MSAATFWIDGGDHDDPRWRMLMKDAAHASLPSATPDPTLPVSRSSDSAASTRAFGGMTRRQTLLTGGGLIVGAAIGVGAQSWPMRPLPALSSQVRRPPI